MFAIQKKIILSLILDKIKAEKVNCTKTWLKRNITIPGTKNKFPEEDVLSVIKYGLDENVLKDETMGYVSINKSDFSISELDYYDCIFDMLQKHYAPRMVETGRFLVARTARKDTKVAGRWTRPDFTVIANRTFPYIRQTEFDIITFEVKRPADCGALAVFEALAHNSAATRSYVFFPMTEKELYKNPQGERIREECVRHGIGLFLVKESYALTEATLILEAQQRPLNPEKCSHFLKSVLEPEELSVLTTWPQ